MIIYPGTHEITSTESIDLSTDVPLAYVNTTSSDYNVNIISFLKNDEKKEVIPYTTFDSQDLLFFDKDNNALSASKYLRRNGNNYIYDPELISNTNSFIPLNYSYYVVGKRNSIYKNNSIYNLNISCIDSVPDLPLSKKLIPLLGDAPDRGVSPQNIIVNNKNKSIQNLTNSVIQDNDFIFTESSNGSQYIKYWEPSTDLNPIQYIQDETVYYNNIRYKCLITHNAASTWEADQNTVDVPYWGQVEDLFKSEMDSTINVVNDYLSYNTNLWMVVHDYTLCNKIMQSNTSTVVNPVCMNNTSDFNYFFDVTGLILDKGIVLHNIFDSNSIPVLIFEYKNQGFLIVTPNEFFDNSQSHADLFYEVMMYVYLQSYVRSQTYTDWITDVMPNYIVVNNNLIQKDKFISSIEPYNMFGLQKNEFQLIDVVLSDYCPYVIFNGFLNDNLIFTKLYTGVYSKYADKYNNTGISLYVNNKIIIIQDFIYTIETSINNNLIWTIENNKIFFNINKFQSSLNSINTIPIQISYDLINNSSILTLIDLYLCYDSNKFYLIEKSNYTNISGVIVAEVQINKQYDLSTVYDMRQRGGGLPEYYDPNYDLLDIGDINGKSYRKGGSIIITVPSRLEPYKDLILTAVKNHMVAEDFPIILFK